MIALPRSLAVATARARDTDAPRCEVCATPIGERHRHVVELGSRGVACACQACAILFGSASGARDSAPCPIACWRDPPFAMTTARDQLGIPVGLAFFVRRSSGEHIASAIPGPAGITDAELDARRRGSALAAATPLARAARAATSRRCSSAASAARPTLRCLPRPDHDRVRARRPAARDLAGLHRRRRGASASSPRSSPSSNAARRHAMKLDTARASRRRRPDGGLRAVSVSCLGAEEPLPLDVRRARTARVVRGRRLRAVVARGAGPRRRHAGADRRPAAVLPDRAPPRRGRRRRTVASLDDGDRSRSRGTRASSRRSRSSRARRARALFAFEARHVDRAPRAARVVRDAASRSTGRIDRPPRADRRRAAARRASRSASRTPRRGPMLAAPREQAIARAFASTHLLIGVDGGELLSRDRSPGVGTRRRRDLHEHRAPIRSSSGRPARTTSCSRAPFILYDHPQIAPESAGDLCDATEIDELLVLRTRTMTDDEKRAGARDRSARRRDHRPRRCAARTSGSRACTARRATSARGEMTPRARTIRLRRRPKVRLRARPAAPTRRTCSTPATSRPSPTISTTSTARRSSRSRSTTIRPPSSTTGTAATTTTAPTRSSRL